MQCEQTVRGCEKLRVGCRYDAGAKGLQYKTFTANDLQKHKENSLMLRLINVAILEVNLNDSGINYAQELQPHCMYANRPFCFPEATKGALLQDQNAQQVQNNNSSICVTVQLSADSALDCL
jgi:hypothetical protein